MEGPLPIVGTLGGLTYVRETVKVMVMGHGLIPIHSHEMVFGA